jgi:hypothetical protein
MQKRSSWRNIPQNSYSQSTVIIVRSIREEKGKMKKLLAIAIVAIFLASMMPMSMIKSASATPINGPIKGLTHPKMSPPSDAEELPAFDGSAFMELATADGIEPELQAHSPWSVAVSDDYMGGFYYLDFQQVLSGVHCNVWVGLAPDVWTGGYQDEWATNGPGFDDDVFYFAYPWTYLGGAFWGASRLQPGYRDYIFGSQLVTLMNEFDTNIWGKDTSFFGMYADRPGPLNDYKIQILIFNIRDGLFWDPVTAPYFTEGYFWSYISNLYNSNIIHIDTYQWFRRQGPTPDGGSATYFVSPTYPVSARYPFEYEGTFAHEFQHLIHRDIDADEYSWVNEGCSELAQIICGYGFPTSHLANYMDDFWETSLVIWEGTLADYGAVAFFTYYMYEHYGGQPFIYALVHEQDNGIKGYNDVLKARHIWKNFDQIFQDWGIANYLDDTSFANGIYGYFGLDIPSAATQGLYISDTLAYYQAVYPSFFDWQVYSYPNTGYNYPYGNQLPYVVNYVEFYDGSPALKVNFNGDDYTGVAAHSPTNEWYSDGTAWSWFRLGKTFAIPAGGATLKFWSNYDIEEDWDYGYVEVHDLATDEWYTLPGTQTVSTLPNPQDNPNCPDAVEPFAYNATGRWNAFTGYGGGWYQEQMSLTPFAGHNIELYFTYWTDGYTQMLGWYIDDIEIPELSYLDNVEGGAGGWTANGWYITTGIVPNKFQVNFITTVEVNLRNTVTTLHYISHMYLNKAQDGCMLLIAMNTKFFAFGPSIMVAANQPGYEHNFGTYYEFTADVIHCGH